MELRLRLMAKERHFPIIHVHVFVTLFVFCFFLPEPDIFSAHKHKMNVRLCLLSSWNVPLERVVVVSVCLAGGRSYSVSVHR